MMDPINTPAVAPLVQSQVPARDEKAWEAAKAFETFFLSQFLESMSSGLTEDATFGAGAASGPWKSMINQENAKAMVNSGGVGIAENIYGLLLNMQQASSEEQTP